MKYNPGDCLSFEVMPGTFLAGFISDVHGDTYIIALASYRDNKAPEPDYFLDCPLFAVKLEMNNISITSLSVINMNCDYADQADTVQKITSHPMPGFISTAGFYEINSVYELLPYFESGGKNKQGLMDMSSNCIVPISEFFKNATPRNEFSTVKLYKNIDGQIHYFQIYGDSKGDSLFLVSHWGMLGQYGQHIHIKDKELPELREMYTSQISEKRSEGYSEGIYHRMILQFAVLEGWGDLDDLDFRNQVMEYLDRYFYWTGNGITTGGDIGSGTINIFFEALSPDIAIHTIQGVFQIHKIDREYLVAIETNETDKSETDSYGIKVLYPKDHSVPFFY